MSYTTLLNRLGFEADPFAKTNADEEEKLNRYFISPPFFNAVLGDINTPKSAVVFAPRGGGKTALKRMIEIDSKGKPMLCITYNTFPIGARKLEQIDQEFHLKNLARLIMIGLIASIEDSGLGKLTGDDRHMLYLLAKQNFSEIDRSEWQQGISSVQNLSDKAREAWNKLLGPIGVALNALMAKIGFSAVELERFKDQDGADTPYIEQLRVLAALAKKIGHTGIYVLIDKIDEVAITGNVASSSYAFIAPVLKDLQLLELSGFGFKCFLWDLLLPEYRTHARPDRVKFYELNWKSDTLKSMLGKRLAAYSNGTVVSLNSICEPLPSHWDADDLVAQFSAISPRNVVRLCKEILDQQSEIDADVNKISIRAFELGIETFARNYTVETFSEGAVRDLKRVKRAEFTINHVSTNVFKISPVAGGNKVRSWQDVGAVKKLGSIQETEGAKGSNHYGVCNLLVAKHIFDDMPIFQFLEKKVQICKCGELLIRDWDTEKAKNCHTCQSTHNHVARV